MLREAWLGPSWAGRAADGRGERRAPQAVSCAHTLSHGGRRLLPAAWTESGARQCRLPWCFSLAGPQRPGAGGAGWAERAALWGVGGRKRGAGVGAWRRVPSNAGVQRLPLVPPRTPPPSTPPQAAPSPTLGGRGDRPDGRSRALWLRPATGPSGPWAPGVLMRVGSLLGARATPRASVLPTPRQQGPRLASQLSATNTENVQHNPKKVF